MSKKLKGLIEKELTGRFQGIESLGVINPRGIDANRNNHIRRKLHEKGLRMTVVKNNLARRAIGGKLTGFDSLLDGPSALVYGEASASVIARLLLDEKKVDDKLELRGVFFDGEVYAGDAGVERVSKMPTREEAIANIIGAILGPGRKLAGAIKGPGGKLGAVLKTIEEKAKEKEGAAPEAAPAA
ncbi:MAG: 50S ribosomal protein L10 [Phycisphaerales bacterium]|nr:50S ribosomal protein L10 [Phycisphaerales bacterium]